MSPKKIWMLSMVVASVFTILFYFYISSGKEQASTTEIQIQNKAETGKVSAAKKETETPKMIEKLKIEKGKRALSIAVDHVKGVSGLIRPGNIVDVISYIPEDAKGPSKTEILLEGIRVLAVGSQTSVKNDPALELTYPTVTVEVTPKQALSIANVAVKGSMTLMLRNSSDNGVEIFKADEKEGVNQSGN